MYKLSVLLMATFALSQAFATDFPIGLFKTRSSKTYQFFNLSSLPDLTAFEGSFKFKIKAKNDVAIALSSGGNQSDIEFIIGALKNMETRIRVNETDIVKMKTPMILNGTDFQQFEIKWNWNGDFYFTQHLNFTNQTENTMLFKRSMFPVNEIGIKTGSGGEWIVREKQLPKIFGAFIKPLNNTKLFVGDRLKCVVTEKKNDTEPIYVHTSGNGTHTNISLSNPSFFRIQIRAKNNAHIKLRTFDSYPNIQMNFGLGPSLSFSMLFNGSEIGNVFVPNLLNEHEYREFWIDINHNQGNISIGKSGSGAFLNRAITTFPIDFIDVKTTNGNDGDWKITPYFNHTQIVDFPTICYVDVE